MAQLVLLAQVAATLVMVGIIWYVQLVHYPLFDGVGKRGFQAYAEAHSRQTGIVVGPPMLVELISAGALLFIRPAGVPALAAWVGLSLLAVVWLSTAVLQIPAHRALGSGFDHRTHRTLVLSNWVRTSAWTARGGLVLWMAAMAIG